MNKKNKQNIKLAKELEHERNVALKALILSRGSL